MLFRRAGKSGGSGRPAASEIRANGNSYHEAEKERHAIEVLIRRVVMR